MPGYADTYSKITFLKSANYPEFPDREEGPAQQSQLSGSALVNFLYSKRLNLT